MLRTTGRLSRAVRKVEVTLAVGAVLVLAAVAVALTRSPPRVARVGVPTGDANAAPLGKDLGDATICQGGETLPAGVTGVRIGMWAFMGARMHVRVYSGSRVITEGSRGPNWTSDSVTVPVRPVAHATSDVNVCIAIGPNNQPLTLLGAEKPPAEQALGRLGVSSPTPAAAGNGPVGGKLGLEYISASSGSWLTRVSAVAKRMGFGRAFSGSWIALLVAALTAGAAILAARLAWRELRGVST